MLNIDYEVSKYTEQKYIKHNLKNVDLYVTKRVLTLISFLVFLLIYNRKCQVRANKREHKSADISYFIGDKK